METEHKNIRELSPKECDSILTNNSLAHLGCHRHGEVYVVPIVYAYDGEYIYGHSLMGKKIEMMRSHPQVCVQIEEIQNIFNWKSVIVNGAYEELREGFAPVEALRQLKVKIAGMVEGLTPLQVEVDAILSSAVIYRIKIKTITGRSERTS